MHGRIWVPNDDISPLATLAKRANDDISPLATLAKSANDDISPLATLAKRANDDISPLATLAKRANDDISPLATLAKGANDDISLRMRWPLTIHIAKEIHLKFPAKPYRSSLLTSAPGALRTGANTAPASVLPQCNLPIAGVESADEDALGYFGDRLRHSEMWSDDEEPAHVSKLPRLTSGRTFGHDGFSAHRTRVHGGSSTESNYKSATLRSRGRDQVTL
ncbi:hypothetical protein AVEN_214948-1 [Araneus ventricosus]|uniref:Uncharacterized protein n=1 Tax=Araneus ventricosus TaxID=182803 RepID=A0A4Y2DAW4_ARAVE|nr:hypothetical protein AVEN_214948-1 [Araneus ventricosus]